MLDMSEISYVLNMSLMWGMYMVIYWTYIRHILRTRTYCGHNMSSICLKMSYVLNMSLMIGHMLDIYRTYARPKTYCGHNMSSICPKMSICP